MMEPIASDASTYLDCALQVDSRGNISTTVESPIMQQRGFVGLDTFLNRSNMQFTCSMSKHIKSFTPQVPDHIQEKQVDKNITIKN